MKDIKKKESGAPRKYDYKGTKKVTSIRLSEDEKKEILKKYDSIQQFIQGALDNINLL